MRPPSMPAALVTPFPATDSRNTVQMPFSTTLDRHLTTARWEQDGIIGPYRIIQSGPGELFTANL